MDMHTWRQDSHTCGCLEMASSVIALRDECVVVSPALQRFVEGYRWAHELLLDLS